jgi:glycosyltransferase involved in cell wall biosynthesis
VKNILILIKGLGRGGAEQLLLSGAPHLNADKFDYEVAYLLPRKRALVTDLERENTPVHCLHGGQGLRWVQRLRALVRGRGIDLVHAHLPLPAIGARMGLMGLVPIVCTEHNVWSRYHWATYWANMLTYARNDHVFAVSDEVRRSIRYPAGLQYMRMPPVETLHHGIDHSLLPQWAETDGVREELGIPVGAPAVGMVANFKTHKAHEVLLRAMISVRSEVPGTHLVLVGQGPLEADVRRLADHLGLNGSVTFTGQREDAQRIAATFDVFALSSIQEGFPIAVIEAMALGRPVVATAVGGVPELIRDGDSGFLVPVGNHRALAERITALLRDPSKRARIGEAARARAKDFDIRNAVHRMEQVYEELLA